jgi:desulfoferrodoxin (superoxide reductase-like protein)
VITVDLGGGLMPSIHRQLEVCAICLVAALFFSVIPGFVRADVPSIQLSTTISDSSVTLMITVAHNAPSSAHYVDEVELTIANGTGTFTYDLSAPSAPQNNPFLVSYEMGSNANGTLVEVRAHCNIHGWSSASTLEIGLEEDDNSSAEGSNDDSLYFVIGDLVLTIAAISMAAVMLWRRSRKE